MGWPDRLTGWAWLGVPAYSTTAQKSSTWKLYIIRSKFKYFLPELILLGCSVVHVGCSAAQLVLRWPASNKAGPGSNRWYWYPREDFPSGRRNHEENVESPRRMKTDECIVLYKWVYEFTDVLRKKKINRKIIIKRLRTIASNKVL